MLGDGRLHRPTLVLQQCALSTIADIRSLEDHAAMARSVIAALLLNVCIGADLLCAPAGATTFSGTSIELFNPDASRRIPLRVYHPGSRRALAVLLPGLGAQPGDYSFLAKYLARRGFAVAEVQLELPGDPPIANSGNIAALRAPELRSGVNTVRYTIGQLDRLRYASATRPIVLVGHSNGGDVAMLFGSEYPAEVGVIFSLDNLRVAIPRTSRPHICSLRSSDQEPDEGVVPNNEQRRRFNVHIQATKIRHDQMWNGATNDQRRVMIAALRQCLDHRA